MGCGSCGSAAARRAARAAARAGTLTRYEVAYRDDRESVVLSVRADAERLAAATGGHVTVLQVPRV